jgi:hypothetical protein
MDLVDDVDGMRHAGFRYIDFDELEGRDAK